MDAAPPPPFAPRSDALVRVLPLVFWGYVALMAAVPLGVSLAVTPEDIESGRVTLTPKCKTLAETGKPCATCGLTRAFAALGHGRFSDARGYHAASPLLYAAAVLVVFGAGGLFVRRVARLRRRDVALS